MNRRSGYTLIQVVMAIGIAGLAMTISATLMHSLYRMGHAQRMQLEHETAMQRLTHRLRDDALRASDLEIESTDSEQSIAKLIVGSEETISYTPTGEAVERVHMRGGEAVHRDQFRVGHHRLSATRRVQHDVPTITLEVHRQSNEGGELANSATAIVIVAGRTGSEAEANP